MPETYWDDLRARFPEAAWNTDRLRRALEFLHGKPGDKELALEHVSPDSGEPGTQLRLTVRGRLDGIVSAEFEFGSVWGGSIPIN